MRAMTGGSLAQARWQRVGRRCVDCDQLRRQPLARCAAAADGGEAVDDVDREALACRVRELTLR